MANRVDEVSSILGNRPVITDDASRSVSAGTAGATERDGNGDGRDTNNPSPVSDSDNRTTGGHTTVNPADATNDGDDEPARRNSSSRRGAGKRASASSGTRTRASKNQDATFHLGDLLFTVHTMLAGMTGEAELMLTPEQANNMATATERVMAFYKHTMLTPLQLAWLNLAATAGLTYGPMIFAIKARQWADADSKTINATEPAKVI